MKEKIQGLLKDRNKILLLVPIIAGIVLIFVFFSLNTKDGSGKQDGGQSVRFEPESKEDMSVRDKVSAYDKDRREEQRNNYQLRGSEFYRNLRDRDREEYEREAAEKMQEGIGARYEDMFEDDSAESGRPYPRTALAEEISRSLEEAEKRGEVNRMLDEYVKQNRLSEEEAEILKRNKELNRKLGIADEEEEKDTVNPEVAGAVDTVPAADVHEGVFLVDSAGNRSRRPKGTDNTRSNLIRACVHGSQTIYSGTAVRLRLLEPIVLDGHEIPRNTIFYGTAGAGGSRLRVTVENIRIGSYITPVSYIIYDNDAMEGLNVPNNVKAEAKRRIASRTVSSINLPLSSIGTLTSEITSAVNAVTSATRNVLQTQLNVIKVEMKANYQIYIKEESREEKEAREKSERASMQEYIKSLEPQKTNSLKDLVRMLEEEES